MVKSRERGVTDIAVSITSKSMAIAAAIAISGCTTPGYYTLASQIKGQIVEGGAPVVGARIVYQNSSHWYGNRKIELATDANGKFRIPSWKKASLITLLHQPVIDHRLEILYRHKTYLGWKLTRLNYDGNGELGRRIELHCELSATVTKRPRDDVGMIEGICTEK